jgi:hypothetical protein
LPAVFFGYFLDKQKVTNRDYLINQQSTNRATGFPLAVMDRCNRSFALFFFLDKKKEKIKTAEKKLKMNRLG